MRVHCPGGKARVRSPPPPVATVDSAKQGDGRGSDESDCQPVRASLDRVPKQERAQRYEGGRQESRASALQQPQPEHVRQRDRRDPSQQHGKSDPYGRISDLRRDPGQHRIQGRGYLLVGSDVVDHSADVRLGRSDVAPQLVREQALMDLRDPQRGADRDEGSQRRQRRPRRAAAGGRRSLFARKRPLSSSREAYLSLFGRDSRRRVSVISHWYSRDGVAWPADTTPLDRASRNGYLAAGVCGAAALIIGLLLGPAIGEAIVPTQDFDYFLGSQGPFFNQPEPTEFARYAIAALAAVMAASAVVLAANWDLPAWARRASAVLSVVVPIVVVIALIVAWFDRGLLDRFLNERFEFFDNLQGVVALVLALVIAVAAGNETVRRFCDRATSNRRLIKWAPVLALVVAILFLLPAIQTEGSFPGASLFVSSHMASTVAGFEAFANGATPGVDVAAQYSNLLPYPLTPLFEFADFEPGAMTIIFAALNLAILLCFFRVLTAVAGSAVVAVALFVPVVALSVTPSGGEGAGVVNNANVFQVMPIRYLGPAVVAWLLMRHLCRARRDVGVFGIFLVAGLAAISTPDFGVATVIAASIALLLASATEPSPWACMRRLGRDALLGIAAAAALFTLITLLRSGSLPQPDVLLYYPELFGAKGFGLTRMDTIGLHWLLYATFAGALILAAVRATAGETNRVLTGMLAFFGVLGLAAGVYFVGRSNQFTLIALFPTWGMTIAMLALVVLRSLAERSPGLSGARTLGPLGWAVLVALGLAIAGVGWLQAPWKQVDRLTTEIDFPTFFAADASVPFVEDRTDAGEPTAFICRNGYLLAERAGVRNVSPIDDPQSIAAYSQVGEIVDALRSAGGSKVFTCEKFSPLRDEIDQSLAARGFTKVGEDQSVLITEWSSERP